MFVCVCVCVCVCMRVCVYACMCASSGNCLIVKNSIYLTGIDVEGMLVLGSRIVNSTVEY